MADSPPRHVRAATDAAVTTITLDRPEARNAYSDEMVAHVVATLDAAARDGQVRCVILTGAGRGFHAGGDVKAMKARSGMFAGDPAELQMTKRAAYDSWNGEVHRALELAATYQGIAQTHPDHQRRLDG